MILLLMNIIQLLRILHEMTFETSHIMYSIFYTTGEGIMINRPLLKIKTNLAKGYIMYKIILAKYCIRDEY